MAMTCPALLQRLHGVGATVVLGLGEGVSCGSAPKSSKSHPVLEPPCIDPYDTCLGVLGPRGPITIGTRHHSPTRNHTTTLQVDSTLHGLWSLRSCSRQQVIEPHGFLIWIHLAIQAVLQEHLTNPKFAELVPRALIPRKPAAQLGQL